MQINNDDLDPLKLNEWFQKSYSVLVTTLLIFLILLYPAWMYISDWFESIYENGLLSNDISFIKALSFIFVLLATNITYIALSKHVGLSRTLKDQENQLDLYELKFQNIIDNVPDVAVQGFDSDYCIHYWNNASEKIYGYSKTEAIGQKINDLLVPAENKHDFDNVVNSILDDTNHTSSMEIDLISMDGKQIPVFSSFSVVEVPERQAEIFSMEIDLSQRIMMENELIEARIIADTSNNAKSEFLANMSHEIRTPLNSIIGFSDMLSDNLTGPLNEKQIKYAQYISESGKHLLRIINDILDLSKAESGKMELEFESFDLDSFISGVIESIKPLANAKNISIVSPLQPKIREIEADAGKLKQVLYNLIGNAVKFSDEGGIISITYKQIDNSIHFEIRDDGMGIKEEDIKKLFKPFSQLDNQEGKTKGTGLGLSLVKKMVELHGGNIWVKSEYGKYSVFGFSIPLKNSESLV